MMMRAKDYRLCYVALAPVLALTLAHSAWAGGVEDGEAGLKSLDRGDYAGAVRLFTVALDAGDLADADREFAYLNRGKAYLAMHDRAKAVADLREAVKLKRDDSEAQDALRSALASNVTVQTPAPSRRGTDRWGLLRAMVGKYYWYEIPGQKPHSKYMHLTWLTPELTMIVSQESKKGLVAVGEYKFDEEANRLLASGVQSKTAYYSTADVNATSLSEFGYFKDTPIHSTLTRMPDGSFDEHQQTFTDSRWQDAGDARWVETSAQELQAARLLK